MVSRFIADDFAITQEETAKRQYLRKALEMYIRQYVPGNTTDVLLQWVASTTETLRKSIKKYKASKFCEFFAQKYRHRGLSHDAIDFVLCESYYSKASNLSGNL